MEGTNIKNGGNHNKPTLGPDQYDWNLRGIPIMGHFIEVVRNRIIADLVFQAEHEDYGVHPSRKL